MSPDAYRLATLVQQIRIDREAFNGHVATVRDALGTSWEPGTPVLAVVAVALHHGFGAAESIFERISKAFEGMPEQDDRWHRTLLDQMSLDLPEIRPAVLARETSQALAPVLGFRHFFRHAYAVSLDPRRLRIVAEDLTRAAPLLTRDLDLFELALQRAMAELGAGGK